MRKHYGTLLCHTRMCQGGGIVVGAIYLLELDKRRSYLVVIR